MNRRLTYAAAPLALALILSGCSGDSAEQATVTVTADSDAAATDGTEDGNTATTEGDDEATDGTNDATEEVVEPAEAQTIELDETFTHSDDRSAFTMTLHRAVINDYYVEVEASFVNDGDADVRMWSAASYLGQPELHDEAGRVFPFQPQAGLSGSNRWNLKQGEGANTTMVFVGAVSPDTRELTLKFEGIDDVWRPATFTIPVGGS